MKPAYVHLWLCAALAFESCNSDAWLEEIYVEPQSSFDTDKDVYGVLETVHFTNTGAGSLFTIWPGDKGHCYGTEGDTGFAAGSDGCFAYAYDEPGEYEAVWVASSINAHKEPVAAVSRCNITVVDAYGGLDRFVISNLYRMREYPGTVYYNAVGQKISADSLMCPIIWDAWRKSNVNSMQALQLIEFDLTSPSASFAWYDRGANELRPIKSGISTSRIVNFLENGRPAVQKFVITGHSGRETAFYVAPVLIPAFTAFSINGVKGTIERDLAFYNRYDVSVKLPAGTDPAALVPQFTVMNGDAALLNGDNVTVRLNGRQQESGITAVDFSHGEVTYTITHRMAGETNAALSQISQIKVRVELEK